MTIRFQLLGIPVRIQPWFFLTALLIGPGRGAPAAHQLAWVGMVFVGVMLHELGHAMAGRALGFEPAIELHAFGGATGWLRSRSLTPGRDILITASGPAVGIIVGCACYAAYVGLGLPRETLGEKTLAYAIMVNLGWALLNLLPVLPLDGGRIVTAIAEAVWRQRGRVAARCISLGLTVSLAVWALVSREWWIAVLAGVLTWINWSALKAEAPALARGVPVAVDGTDLGKLAQAYNRRDWPAVLAAAEEILAQPGSDALRRHGLYFLAWGRLALGDVQAARAAVTAMPPAAGTDDALNGCLLSAEGKPAEALPLLAQALARGAEPLVVEHWQRSIVASGSSREAADFVTTPGARNLPDAVIGDLRRAAETAGELTAAADLGAALFRRSDRGGDAVEVASLLARAGQLEEAEGWLKLAAAAATPPDPALLERAELDPLRSSAAFEELRRRSGVG